MAKKKTKRKRTLRQGSEMTLSKRRRSRKVKPYRKRARKKRGMLSEAFTPANARATGEAMFSGGFGGTACYLIDKITPERTPTQKALIMAAGGFVAGAVLGKQNVAAGMAAVATFVTIQQVQTGMSEGKNANWANPIEKLPVFLNENNEPLMLAENENEMLAENNFGRQILTSLYQSGYSTNVSGYDN